MTSTKASSIRQNSSQLATILKTVGLVTVIAALLDILILPIPYQPFEPQWSINFTTQVVDRGVVPLVGLAFLMTGFWFDGGRRTRTTKRSNWQSLSFWALLLAGLLGIFYLLLFPYHLNNVRLSNRQTVEQITQEASQAEGQLEARLSAELTQQQAQIEQLLQNEQQLNQAIEGGQVPEEQAELLRQFQQNPQALNQYLNQRVDELRNQFQTEIGVRREEALSAARIEALKSGLRIGISSLLLAVGYLLISWTGLKNLGRNSRQPES